MLVELTNNANCAVAKLDGELDEGCVKEEREKIERFIAKNEFGQLVLDFSGISFMDSTGIGMLLGRYKRLKQLGVPIYISNARGHVDFILSTAGIYTIMRKIS